MRKIKARKRCLFASEYSRLCRVLVSTVFCNLASCRNISFGRLWAGTNKTCYLTSSKTIDDGENITKGRMWLAFHSKWRYLIRNASCFAVNKETIIQKYFIYLLNIINLTVPSWCSKIYFLAIFVCLSVCLSITIFNRRHLYSTCAYFLRSNLFSSKINYLYDSLGKYILFIYILNENLWLRMFT